MKNYEVHYYKTENITPDERSTMRKNARGVWLWGSWVKAENGRQACAMFRREKSGFKLRSK